MSEQFETLEDWVAPGLAVLSIGLNPSLPSVRAGFYFANPRNRFWPALNASRLVAEPLTPGTAAMQVLRDRYRIGFTDVVKRPSAGAAALRAADFRRWSPQLEATLRTTRPAIAWFHGKVAWQGFLRHTGRAADDGWGLRETSIGATRCYVTPNPSPANAVFSLEDLVAWYDRLADFRRQCCPLPDGP